MRHRMAEYVRQQFPALKQTVNGYPIAYLDGPGGYQVPELVLAAVRDYMVNMNANISDQNETAIKTEVLIREARSAFGDFFNCGPDEVVFGANMTTLNMFLAQALGRSLNSGDVILITEIDHEANRGPWLQLQERGLVVEEVRLDVDTCTLDLDDFEQKLSLKPKIVALNYASNGLGTVSPVAEMAAMARAAGAITVVDAVHYAAHGPMDVKALQADFLICSAYKFFGPHIGVMFADRDILAGLKPLNIRAQIQKPPFMMESGTLNHEGIAGAMAALSFIEDIGLRFGPEIDGAPKNLEASRKSRLAAGLLAFEYYERPLTDYLIDFLKTDLPGAKIYGPPDGHPRTSTVCFTYQGYTPDQVAKCLGALGLFIRGGHFYAMRPIERLGLMESGGVIRVGISPYNNMAEMERLTAALADEEALKRFVGSH